MKKQSETIDVPAGTILFKENDTSKEIYVLMSGVLSVIKNDHEVSSISRPGTFVGEMASLLDKPRSAEIKVVKDARLLKLDKDIESILKSKPSLEHKLLETIRKRLELVCNKIDLYCEMIFQANKKILYDIIVKDLKKKRRISVLPVDEKLSIRNMIDTRTRNSYKRNDYSLLQQIASEYGVEFVYTTERETHFKDYYASKKDSKWQEALYVSERTRGLETCKRLALLLAQATELLARFELASETKQMMNHFQLEYVVPYDARVNILLDLFEKQTEKIPDDKKEDSKKEFLRLLEEVRSEYGEDLPQFYSFATINLNADVYENALRTYISNEQLNDRLTIFQ